MDDKQFAEFMKKLDIVIKLLVSKMTQGKTLTGRVVTLDSIGLERKDIAWILGEDPHLISQILYQAKKSKGSKEKKK